MAPQALASSSAAQAVPQGWYPTLHVKSHLVPSHVALAEPTGRGHVAQDVVPQLLMLVLDTQLPAQMCVPAGHTPMQAIASGIQLPKHCFWPAGHVPPHTPAVQTAVPPVGAVHGSQDVPQLAMLVLLTHLPAHRWNPVLQVNAHESPTHLATPFGSVGQTWHVAPHRSGSSSRAQAIWQRWYPVMHWKSHFVPSQVACVAPVGTGHGAHKVAQAFTLEFDGHWPAHMCVPVGQVVAQAVPVSMQVPLHRVLALGQDAPHFVPSQVAVPSGTGSHGVHDDPQVRTSLLLTQPPGHMCSPAGH